MTIAIDVGNTRTKVARVEDGRVVARAATATLGDGYRARLDGAVADVLAGAGKPLPAVLSSVVPDATPDVVAAAGARCDGVPLVVTHRLRLPVAVAVAHPERVGTDRICAAAGAVDDSRDDAIVVDAGSAVTVDLVVARRFRGGVIMPGPAAVFDAMAARGRQLPRIDLDAVVDLFPEAFESTEDAMTLGAGLSCLGGILEAVRVLERYAPGASVRITGGVAPRLDERLPAGWIRDPDLCFRGLDRIADLNRPQK